MAVEMLESGRPADVRHVFPLQEQLLSDRNGRQRGVWRWAVGQLRLLLDHSGDE